MFSGVYLYSALPPIVAKLEKTLKSVMLSGHDWMFRKPKWGHRRTTHTDTRKGYNQSPALTDQSCLSQPPFHTVTRIK